MPLCDKGWRVLVSIIELSQPPSMTNAPTSLPIKVMKEWVWQADNGGGVRSKDSSHSRLKARTKSTQGHDQRACSHCCNCAGHVNARHWSQIEQDAELIQTSSRLPLEYTHCDAHTCTHTTTLRNTQKKPCTCACLNTCVRGCACAYVCRRERRSKNSCLMFNWSSS